MRQALPVKARHTKYRPWPPYRLPLHRSSDMSRVTTARPTGSVAAWREIHAHSGINDDDLALIVVGSFHFTTSVAT